MNSAKNPEIRQQVLYRFFIITTVGLAGLLIVVPAAATPPSAMSISFDSTTHNLTVTITHATLDPTTHYIKDVKVNINGQTVNDYRYTSQPTPDTFTYVYTLMPKRGDTIEVTATCSLAGSATRELTIPEGSTGTATGQAALPPVTQKAAVGLLPIAGLLVIVLARKT